MFKFIKKLIYKKPLVVTFYLKSGSKISVKCDKVSSKMSNEGTFYGYNVDGMVIEGEFIHNLALDSLEAITVIRRW